MFFESKKDAAHTSFQPASDRMHVQTKLAIGAVNDPLEAEADAMADRVMSMSSMPVQTSSGSESVQRKCAHCEEEEKEKVQRKPLASFIQRKESASGTVASDSVSSKINSTRGSGAPIENNTKQFMESRFGTDFSGVKIHTGTESVQMSRELNAKAFTVGNDIYFNEGEYQPGSAAGDHLLAHELTHTIQQGGHKEGSIQPKTFIQRKAPATRKTLWLNIGFDSSAQADEKTMKKLYTSIAAVKTAIGSCCSDKKKACDVDVKTSYDWNRVNKPAPSDGDYDNDDKADFKLMDTNRDNIKGHAGGFKVLVTRSTLSETWQGKRITAMAFSDPKGTIWNPDLVVDQTLAHETGHIAGYSGGDKEGGAHDSHKENLMSTLNDNRTDNSKPDNDWCTKVAALAT